MPMAKSPVSNLGDLWRKDSSLIMQRPRSPKVEKRNFNILGNNSKEDWQVVSSAVTALFQRKRLANSELESLTEKVKTVKAEIGNAKLCERFKESILMKGMIILREDIKEKSGVLLLDKLSSTWNYFFRSILPLSQAIFVNLHPADGNSVRDLLLLNFRDIVVLKTKLEETFQMNLTIPQPVVQMLLVLQSVHDSAPPNKNYKKLETLVSYVVSPFLSSTGLRTRPIANSPTTKEAQEPVRIPRPASAAQLTKVTEKLDTVMEIEPMNRRHTFTGSDDCSCSSVFESSSQLNGSVSKASVTSTSTVV